MERRVLPILRTVGARLVPTGDPLSIPEGAFVTLTQALGGTYSVVFNGNMARIDGADADALGFTPEVLKFPEPSSDQIDPAQVEVALASVFDPEIPVNIVDLGLIYDRHIGEDGTVTIQMTLTAPGCGMGPVLVEDIKARLATVPNVKQVEVELVFEPPWSREMMSEEAQLELGLY